MFVVCVAIIESSIIVHAQSASSNQVAIFVYGDESISASLAPLRSALEKAIIDEKDKQYILVDRTPEILGLLKERYQYNGSGMVSDKQLYELGNQLTVYEMCVVQVGYHSEVNEYFFNFRLVDVVHTNVPKSGFYPTYEDNQKPFNELSPREQIRAGHELAAQMGLISQSELIEHRERLKQDISATKTLETIPVTPTVATPPVHTSSADIKALCASIIPGLGLMLKGLTGEGLGYLLGDVALIGGGFGLLSYASGQQAIMDDPTLGYDAYMNAERTRNSAKTTGYICFGVAGVVYIVNLARAYFAEPKPGARLQWSIAPTFEQNSNTAPAIGIGFSLAYNF